MSQSKGYPVEDEFADSVLSVCVCQSMAVAAHFYKGVAVWIVVADGRQQVEI